MSLCGAGFWLLSFHTIREEVEQMMDEEAIVHYIVGAFEGVDVVEGLGDRFFFANPDRNPAPDRRFPFATLVTGKEYDDASNVGRPGVFRLNVGVRKETFRSLFGSRSGDEGEYDFTALDRLMPHPVYGAQFWLCVLNPSEGTFQSVQPLLTEAYARAVARYTTTHRADQA